MLNFLKRNIKFLKLLKQTIKDEKLYDIYLFGSVVRGKDEPKDIDLLIIFEKDVNTDIIYKLRKESEKLLKKSVDCEGKLPFEIFESKFLPREKILAEAYSIRHEKFLYELYGYSSYTLFVYSIAGKNASERIRFHYALAGRGVTKGILKDSEGIKLSNTTILIPIKNVENFSEFLGNWKIEYRTAPILIPSKTLQHKELQIKSQ